MSGKHESYQEVVGATFDSFAVIARSDSDVAIPKTEIASGLHPSQ
jgi:hypothetical protein